MVARVPLWLSTGLLPALKLSADGASFPTFANPGAPIVWFLHFFLDPETNVAVVLVLVRGVVVIRFSM